MKKLILIVLSISAGLLANTSFAIDLYLGAKPQSTGNTCQSYSSVLALAAVKDPEFPIENFEQLRRYEAQFRAYLNAMPGNSPHLTHTNWPTAMQQLTGGKYTFDLQYVSNLADWLNRVAGNTTQSNSAENVIAILTGTGFKTVLTSVLSLDNSNYGGHIVTVLGVTGTEPNSSSQLIAFNSAIKGKGGSVNTCNPGNQPGDHRYKAGVVKTNNFSLNSYNGRFLIMTLRNL